MPVQSQDIATTAGAGLLTSLRLRITLRPPLIEARDLAVHYRVRARSAFGKSTLLRAVDGVDLAMQPGECLGVVGESGCGKSTLARALAGLESPARGEVRFEGVPVASLGRARWKSIQMIFQDPIASLNPRMPISEIIAEPIRNLRPETGKPARALETLALLERVGLGQAYARRYPHELSGGQRQRVAIARALAAQPRLLICDEPLSALDVSIQAQVINLLKSLKDELKLSILFISHDLAAVRHLSERVMVMYAGKVMETAARETLFANPAHPYTRALLEAVSTRVAGDAIRVSATDSRSDSGAEPACPYRNRCPKAQALCARAPELLPWEGPRVACHFPGR